jgi:hypothetical protein
MLTCLNEEKIEENDEQYTTVSHYEDSLIEETTDETASIGPPLYIRKKGSRENHDRVIFY